MTAHDFLGHAPDVAGLGRHLDALSPDERVREVRDLSAAEQAKLFEAAAGFRSLALVGRKRVREVRDLSAAEQAKLFEAAAGFRSLALEDFVPSETAPLRQVIHFGRNSLPVFRRFEKRFCRPERSSSELWGYNEQSFRAFTGPGYFVAKPAERGEILIDYTELPPAKPGAWPEILPNSARLSRFIYDGTRDFMRGVSRHVTIGRATRGGKPMDNWFVLCREEPAPPA